MFRSFLSFRTRHQPYMVRLSYRHELRSAATFPLAASLAEGSFTAVIAAKNFDASIVLMSVITAAPMFGNIMAMVWSELATGRRKVPFVNMLQLGVVLMIASVALTAWLPTWAAGWVFASQIIAARLLASGIVTIRSAIWRANYPRHVRGQVTSRIAVVATAVLAATTFLGSYLLDQDPKAYVYLYPSAAILGAVGIYQFSKVRVRREALLLRREEQVYAPRPENMAQTDEANVLNYDPAPTNRRLFRFFTQAFQVLREDEQFRRYQRYQFLSGFSFMMFAPALLYLVSKHLTDPNSDYLLATAVVQLIPMGVSLVATQAWAPLFDRVHITVFRVVQIGVALAGQLTLCVGALLSGEPTAALAVIALAQVLVGISNGGGNLAWNLGHNDFAPADKAATYMGVHVMLTGLRGCFAPFIGAWLFAVLDNHAGVFALSSCVCLAAVLGFASMARNAPKKVGGKVVAGAG